MAKKKRARGYQRPRPAPARGAGTAQGARTTPAAAPFPPFLPSIAPPLRSPWLVALPIVLLYGLWIMVYVPRSHGGLDLLFVGQQFQTRHSGTAINLDPSYVQTRDPTGYDGQQYYYIAVDPLNARYYVDDPPYRYTRILYPMAARLLALGQKSIIPYTLILVNWLSIAGGTAIVAAWLKRRRYTPWLALAYGLYPGQFVALTLDLTEPMAYALAALGVYLFDYGGRRLLLWAGVSFGLAALTREITLIFPALYGLALLLGKGATGASAPTGRAAWRARLAAGWRGAALLLGLSLLPFAFYKAFLIVWLGSSGVTDYSLLQLPFHGLLALQPWQSWHIEEIWGIVVPALILAALGLWAVWRRVWAVELWVLLVNVEVCVLGLTPASWDAFLAPARIAMGVALAALLCLPRFDAAVRKGYRWISWSSLAICVALWLWLSLNWSGVMVRLYPS